MFQRSASFMTKLMMNGIYKECDSRRHPNQVLQSILVEKKKKKKRRRRRRRRRGNHFFSPQTTPNKPSIIVPTKTHQGQAGRLTTSCSKPSGSDGRPASSQKTHQTHRRLVCRPTYLPTLSLCSSSREPRVCLFHCLTSS